MSFSPEAEYQTTLESDATGPQLFWRLIRENVPSQIVPLTIGIVCMFAFAALSALSVWMLAPAFNLVFQRGDKEQLMLYALAFPALFLARGLLNYGQRVYTTKATLNISMRCQNQIFAHILTLDAGFFSQQRTAMLLSRMSGEAGSLSGNISKLVTLLGKDYTTAIGYIIALFAFDVQMALLALIFIPLVIPLILMMGKRARTLSRENVVAKGLFQGMLMEIFQNIRVVKAYNGDDYEEKRVRGKIRQLYYVGLRTTKMGAFASSLMEVISGITLAGVLLYGSWRISLGTLNPGEIGAFFTTLLLVYQPIRRIGKANVAYQATLITLRRFYGLLDTKPQIREISNAPDLKVSDAEIKLQNVCFYYPGSDVPALSDLNVTIPGGSTVALVGRSGAGKTTLMSLFPRFRDPSVGRLLVDGQDLSKVSLHSLWSNVTMVTQDAILFNASIRENIAFGRPDATFEAIRAAARAAALDEFIESQPDGYETQIGEDGSLLSGGQRQRLVIARAMIKDAPILLLDEATSALDVENERRVRQAFDTLRAGRTSIIIAHRLASIRNSNIIFVMENGRIVAQGTHRELLETSPLYALLNQEQLEREEAEKAAVQPPNT